MKKLILLAALVSPLAVADTFTDNAGAAIGGLLACSIHYQRSQPDISASLNDSREYLIGIIDDADLTYDMYQDLLSMLEDRISQILSLTDNQRDAVCNSIYRATVN